MSSTDKYILLSRMEDNSPYPELNMLDIEHDVTFVPEVKNGWMDFKIETLQPGQVYKLHIGHFLLGSLFDAFSAYTYLDNRIAKDLAKKIITEKEVPIIPFTKIGSELKVVGSNHVVAAACLLDIEFIKGIYVPRSALETEQVEQIFL